ncbi:MAG: hypothetical protein OFPI_22670 [Osedax symbiont Rs2]|nr:MAG: hypothetical protein OFPI_22670 [Osedax symbiont Rs2]
MRAGSCGFGAAKYGKKVFYLKYLVHWLVNYKVRPIAVE